MLLQTRPLPRSQFPHPLNGAKQSRQSSRTHACEGTQQLIWKESWSYLSLPEPGPLPVRILNAESSAWLPV